MKFLKIFSPDRSGLIADITLLMAEKHINIENLEGKAFLGHAVIDMTVDKPNEASIALREKGFKVVSDELITIRIIDEPGSSARVMRELNEAKISLRGISTLERSEGFCYVALSTDNNEAAKKLLYKVII